MQNSLFFTVYNAHTNSGFSLWILERFSFTFFFANSLNYERKKMEISPDLGNLGCSQFFSLFFQFSDVDYRALRGRADQSLLSMCAQGHCSPKIFNCVVHQQCIASRSGISTYLPTLFNTWFAHSLSSLSQIQVMSQHDQPPTDWFHQLATNSGCREI